MISRLKKKLWLLFLLGVGIILQACESGDDPANIYLTLARSSIPRCTLSKEQDCSHIDENSVLAVFRFPRKYLSSKSDIDSYVHGFKLQLSVRPEGISEVVDFDGGVLPGYGFVFIRELFIPDSSIQAQMDWEMQHEWRSAKYVVVESELNGAVKYDEKTCVDNDIGRYTSREHVKQGVDETVVRTCFVYSPQYYHWERYPDAFVTCQRRDQWGDLVVLMSCNITTLVTDDVIAKYTIRAENVHDGSWVDTDQQIKRFLISHVIAGK
jgi:hypothetical protein